MRKLLQKHLFLLTLPIGAFSAITQRKNQLLSEQMVSKLNEMESQNKKLQDKINDIAANLAEMNQSSELAPADEEVQIVENNVEAIRKSIEGLKSSETQINNSVDQTTFEKATDQVTNEASKLNDYLANIVDIFNKGPKGGGPSGTSHFLPESFNQNIFDFIKSTESFYNSLGLVETLSVLHLTGSIIIFLCMLSILNIFFGDKIIKYFELEIKYPKLAKLIELRRNFQHYYLISDFIVISAVLFTLTFVDLYMLLSAS